MTFPVQRWTARHEHVGWHRQTCLGVRVRRTPEGKRRLRELARIGANLNQLARWANTCKRAAEAVEVLTALADSERRIAEFASCTSTDR